MALSQRGALKADVVVDLVATVRPGANGYPFNAARDALQGQARWAFRDLVDEVERENEAVVRHDDEVFDPDSADDDERQGAIALGERTASAFADEDFQKALAEAAGGIAAFYNERAKDVGVATSLPPALRVDDGPTAEPPDVLRVLLGGDAAPTDVVRVLARVGDGPLSGRDAQVLGDAVANAAERALEPGGGGLIAAATILRQADAVLAPTVDAGVLRRPSPFGRLAGLRISKQRYDRQKAARFRKGFARWIPHLTAWDATLRLVATEARIKRRFKPGFVLDDQVIGLTSKSESGALVIYLHPDRFEEVLKAHRERPMAIAAFLHGVACHELTHADGRMGLGHSEEFVVAREDLGAATGHLLPALAVLVQRVLGLPVKPTPDQKRIAQLERQLAKARETRNEHARRSGEVARLEAELGAARAELAEALAESARVRASCDGCCGTCADDSAQRALDQVVVALRAKPPVGVDAAYVDAFVGRNRAALRELLAQALARKNAGGAR
jgi:hypothetical protein